MTRQEIEKKIEDIKNREFYLQMKDRWDWKDYEISRKHIEEIRELEKELEKAWKSLFFFFKFFSKKCWQVRLAMIL